MIITSLKISEEDAKFCKEQGLMYSEVFRTAIYQRKQIIEGLVVDNVFEERRKREKWQKIAEELKTKLLKKQEKSITPHEIDLTNEKSSSSVTSSLQELREQHFER